MVTCFRAEQETMDSRSVAQDFADPLPSRSDETVPVAWEETSSIRLRSHARVNPSPHAERAKLCQKISDSGGSSHVKETITSEPLGRQIPGW